MTNKIVMSLCCLYASSACGNNMLPEVKSTVQVVDQSTGLPMSSVTVHASFLQESNWHEREKYNSINEITDKHGNCILTGRDLDSYFYSTVELDGYYKSSKKISFTSVNRVLNRREPWNPKVELRMREIKNPVSLIRKWPKPKKVAEFQDPIGFDFEVGDWVAPNGKGIRADFFLNMHRRFEHSGDYDAVARITFPTDRDGIQLYKVPPEYEASSFKFPYLAPTNNYCSELVLERHAVHWKVKETFDPDNDLYLFRVRTEQDEDGNILSACYGRMDRCIEIGWGDVLDFEYHFNPVPNVRSLEWNGVNLMKKMPTSSIKLTPFP